MSVPDSVQAQVECAYSNIGKEWIAGLYDRSGAPILEVKGKTRAEAIYNLAEELMNEVDQAGSVQ